MKCKKVICISVVLVLLLATTAFATVGSRTAELVYNNIKVMINGKEVTPTDANGNAVEPFIINGTTYLPVRGVASALGMNVGWDDTTKTVTLDNPGVFQGGVTVYEDKYVTIEFAGCRQGTGYSSDTYYADFNITNRTDAELTFEAETMAFDGISYEFSGMPDIAPQSMGKVSFRTSSTVPTEGISKTSGKIRVIDMDEILTDWDYDYDARWVNVTQ